MTIPAGVPSLKEKIDFPVNQIDRDVAPIAAQSTRKSTVWGVFKDNAGQQSAFSDKVLTHEVKHISTVKVSTAPQEKGAFVSYSFSQNPNGITVKVTKSGDKTKFLSECEAIVKAETLYFVVTPDAVYGDLKAQSMRVARNVESIDLVEIDIEFIEVRIIDRTVIKKTTSVNASQRIDTGKNNPVAIAE